LTAAVGIVSLNGCAHSPAVQDNRDPSQVMNELNSRIQSDQDQQIATLSPDDFKKAKNSYDDANKSLQKTDPDNQDVLAKARESEDWLTKAEKNASVAKISLSGAIEARQNAINAGANTYFKDDFADADHTFGNLTKGIEDGDLGYAKSRQDDLANTYASLEKRSVYRRYAYDPKQALQSAKDQGAKKWAPDQLKDADAKYQALNQAIEANPRDSQNIQTLSVASQQASDQLLKTTQDSKYLASLSPEDRAKKLQEQQTQISSLQGSATEASNLKQQNGQLEQQTAMTEKIKAIQSKFSPDEAEVYQQGNNAIIRLKGIEFPKAQASIPPRNYELMGKVASTVKEFGPQTNVVVAGSTDSTGGQKTNQKLSEERADAVKNFLVSQDAVPEDHIQTQGLGSTKPIATNKTAEGRKANRRVDVTIEPSQATS
jgi:OOP family OmpA-OmpF porin